MLSDMHLHTHIFKIVNRSQISWKFASSQWSHFHHNYKHQMWKQYIYIYIYIYETNPYIITKSTCNKYSHFLHTLLIVLSVPLLELRDGWEFCSSSSFRVVFSCPGSSVLTLCEWMMEWQFIMRIKNFHTRIKCTFIVLELGKKKHTFSHMCTTHTQDKWEGELQTTVKEVHLESRLERLESVSLMLLGRAFHWKGRYIWRLTGHIALLYSPWAHEHQEVTHSQIGEKKMELMVEWTQRDRVTGTSYPAEWTGVRMAAVRLESILPKALPY